MPIQTLQIISPPEAPPVKAKELRHYLWTTHTRYEWSVKELKSRSWISVLTQLPEHDHSVLVNTSDDTILIDRYYPEQQEWSEAKMWGYRVTHWMPLPDPPKG
jgi:hypothetical protein